MTDAELRRLCRDRPLRTVELHEGNDFYGHAAVIKRYIGWPARRSLPVAIEHGVMINDSVWALDARTLMPLFLCSSRAHAETYTRQTGKRAEAVGPFLRYAATMPAPARDRRVLVVFPAHSNHRLHARFDVDQFVNRIAGYRAEFDRVVVCLYWKDVLVGWARPFRAHGFDCVSAGHMFDPDFLPRLAEILGGATHVTSNEVGSQILYAVASGRAAWIDRQRIEYAAVVEGVEQFERPEYQHPNVVRMFELFGRRHDEITAEQRQFVDDLTGAAHFRSPDELGALVEAAAAEQRRGRSILATARALAWRSRYWAWVAQSSVQVARARLGRLRDGVTPFSAGRIR